MFAHGCTLPQSCVETDLFFPNLIRKASWSFFFLTRLIYLGGDDTLQGTNIFHTETLLKMMFLFPRWDILVSWRLQCQHKPQTPPHNCNQRFPRGDGRKVEEIAWKLTPMGEGGRWEKKRRNCLVFADWCCEMMVSYNLSCVAKPNLFSIDLHSAPSVTVVIQWRQLNIPYTLASEKMILSMPWWSVKRKVIVYIISSSRLYKSTEGIEGVKIEMWHVLYPNNASMWLVYLPTFTIKSTKSR